MEVIWVQLLRQEIPVPVNGLVLRILVVLIGHLTKLTNIVSSSGHVLGTLPTLIKMLGTSLEQNNVVPKRKTCQTIKVCSMEPSLIPNLTFF